MLCLVIYLPILDCEYVSAEFEGNTPQVDEEGNIVRDEKGKAIKEIVRFENGKLIKGTLEKNALVQVEVLSHHRFYLSRRIRKRSSKTNGVYRTIN